MRFLRGHWAIAAAVLLTTPVAGRAQNVELSGDYDQATPPAVSQSVAGAYAASEAPVDAASGQPCGLCEGTGCAACDPRLANRACADPCPRIGFYGFGGVDSWRGVSEGQFQNNNGFSSGINGGVPLPWLGTYGFGAQFGGSYGVYDLNGRSTGDPNNRTANSALVQQQIFITTGFFRRATATVPLAFGIVHDWMLNDQFGTFANSPTLSQLRMQAGWAFNACNEIGAWGAVHTRTATRQNVFAPGLTQTYQAINQVDFFWHHKWMKFGGDSWFYAGVPQQSRLNQGAAFPAGAGGTLGEFIVGTNWLVPLSSCVSMYANAVYMKPSSHAGVQPGGAVAAAQEFWNLSFGLAIYPQHAARSTTVAGRTWMPYMPVANNGSFFVDTDRTQ